MATKSTRSGSHRKGPKKGESRKRSAAAKKAWQTRVRRYGKKAVLEAMRAGRKLGSTRRKKRRGSKPASTSFRRRDRAYDPNLLRRLRRNPALILAEIKKREGTQDLPATPAELRLARILSKRGTLYRSPSALDPEERRRRAFEERIKLEKRREAARRVAAEYQRQQQLEREKREKEAADRIAAEMSKI